MPKHTKGPWRVRYHAHDEFAGEVTAPHGIICSCINDRSTGTFYRGDKAEANANLIALAPEMLEALEKLVEPCPPDFVIEWAKGIISKAKMED